MPTLTLTQGLKFTAGVGGCSSGACGPRLVWLARKPLPFHSGRRPTPAWQSCREHSSHNAVSDGSDQHLARSRFVLFDE